MNQTTPHTTRKKIRNYLIKHIVIWLFVMVGLFSLLVFFLNDYVQLGKEVVVPRVVNMPINEVIDTLKKYNLTYKIQDTQKSTTVPSGFVLYQYPPAGEITKEKRTIVLILSALTSSRGVFPNVVGDNLRTAIFKLMELQIHIKDTVFVDTVRLGQVISALDRLGRSINEGAPIKPGDSVTLYVGSKQMEMINVPQLVGMGEAEARIVLQSRKLQMGTVHGKGTNPAGFQVVVKQQPLSVDSFGNIYSLPENAIVEVWVE